jgi:Tol biopolymer transport system component/protocatechuate 3,4-dioxygenase beta subunit
MVNQTNEDKWKKIMRHLVHHINASRHHLIALLFLTSALAACGVPSSVPAEVVVQTALPTLTLEPTFTPLPPPTNTPQSSPTATPAEPTLTLTPQSVLSGRILDQDTHQPVAGATVRVGAASATTDAEGHYTLTGLPPGQYALSVTHPDYDPGLSSIFTPAAGQEQSLDLALYAPDTSPYPKDPMLTNPLDPNGAPTAEDAERLAREQGLTGEVMGIRETKLSGEYLINYKIGDEVRAAFAELNHEVWELTDDAGRVWWILKVCGNLASPLPQEAPIATPAPRPLPPMAEVIVDDLIVRACASEECAEVGAIQRGARVEVLGCLADGSWCQVGLSNGGGGWCMGRPLRQLAVAQAVRVLEVILPTVTPGATGIGKGRIIFPSGLDIYLVNADGSGLTRLIEGSTFNWSPAWSPDGQRILFVSIRDGNWEIYVMNADGSDQTRLTDSMAFDNFPAWSPDSRQITFLSEQQDDNDEIFVVNADGSGLMRLTNHPASDQCPAWSSNGQQIAFLSNRDGNSEIYVMNADGSEQVNLSNNPADEGCPVWSPDGQRIAFVSSRDGNPEVYVMKTYGSNTIRLTNSPANDKYPTWSPDGQQIAFQSDRDGNEQIYITSADGSSLVRLTNDSAGYGCSVWSPDGKQIATVSNRDTNTEIHNVYVINADGSNLMRLSDRRAFGGCPSWTR